MKDLRIEICRIISTVFLIGYVPFASGTFGTLSAVLFVWLLKPTFVWQAVILILVIAIGIIAAEVSEKSFGEKDPSRIVIDEFAGYLCSVFMLPLRPGYLIAAFFLFRFFDILKPPPIRSLERIRGGAGIMLDDVAAGVITNILLQIIRIL